MGESQSRNLRLSIGARSNRDDEIGRWPRSDILDAMFFIGVDESQISRAERVMRAIDCEFYPAFANQPHF